MTKPCPEVAVKHAMQQISGLDIPEILRESIERHGCVLMELASGLSRGGMEELQVQSVLNKACSSYRAELISAILSIKRAS